MSASNPLREKIQTALAALGAPTDLIERRSLPIYADAEELVVAAVSQTQREHCLIPAAAAQWRRLNAAAEREGISLIIISAFRSFDRQCELIQAKLDEGRSIEDVFSVNIPPGCSEHHTGRAVDVGTFGCKPLSISFETTDAFRWLKDNAARYGFSLSYPKDNSSGVAYEPWHWCYKLLDC